MVKGSVSLVVVTVVVLAAAGLSAQPDIYIDPQIAYVDQPLLSGSVRTHVVTVTNGGNAPLVVTAIDVIETEGGPGGWLSVSPTDFTVLPGAGNSQQIEIQVDASRCDLSVVLFGELHIVSNAPQSWQSVVYTAAPVVNPAQDVHWDTVFSHEYMFDPFLDPGEECVALAVSDGGAFGLPGWNDLGMDYYESGTECSTRDADRVYLNSGSPFVMIKDGENVSLTTSTFQSAALKEYHWRQAEDSPGMSGGIRDMSGGEYADTVYIGKLVNRDTTIALERTFYARRYDWTTEDRKFVVCLSKFYSADGLPHNHVTIGNVVDWNIPSDVVIVNSSSVSASGFVYLRGTDTAGSASCQSNTSRFATEAFATGYTQTQITADPCYNNYSAYYSMNALDQRLLVDTTHLRDGTDLDPDQPNPQVWWAETGVPGLNANSETQDQAVWLTYKHDYNLSASDTLYYWTVLTTVRNGNSNIVVDQFLRARDWVGELRGCQFGYCCYPRVGDANGDWNSEPTIGDVSVMIDAKFVTGACIAEGPMANIKCLTAADINQSGGVNPTCDDITIGDISILIDYLFITGPTLELPFCAW